MENFKFYRSQILFIGLNTDEKLNIESGLNKYSIFYKDTFAHVSKIESFDLICLPEEDYFKNENVLLELKKPIITIGNNLVPKSRGVIKRPIFVRQCLELLQQILPPVKKPALEPLEVGTVVKSKTTPAFGKGIVISLLSEFEVLVRFPNSNLISSKDKAIRCHKAHLQILGNIHELV